MTTQKERGTRHADASFSVQTQIVLQAHVNGMGRLFGGQLMSWMDVTGAVAARRHSGCEVVTVSVDALNFLTAAKPNDIVTIEAKLVYVGTSSMHTLVSAFVETAGGKRQSICTSTFIFVALDAAGQPTCVPLLAEEGTHKGGMTP